MKLSTLTLSAILLGTSWATTSKVQNIYEKLSNLPTVYRRAAYLQLDDDIQRDLWLHHIRRYRLVRRSMTDRQHETYEKIEASLLRAFGAVEDDSIEDEVVGVFGEIEGMNIIATLGPPGTRTGGLQQGLVGTSGSGKCSMGPECNCHKGSSDCRPCGDGASCVSSPTGCGVWWREPCDGI